MPERATRGLEYWVDQLETYKKANGHLHVPYSYVTDSGEPLGRWVTRARHGRRKGTLRVTDGQLATLDAIGFDWEGAGTHGQSWSEGIAALDAYIIENGHTQVPVQYISAGGFPLGRWLRQVAAYCRAGNSSMTTARIGELDTRQVLWRDTETAEQKWDKWVSQLEDFIREHGHGDVHNKYVTPAGQHLGTWANRIRSNRSKGHASLTAERISQLEKLGFDWRADNTSDALWARRLDALDQYIAENGHPNVPGSHITADGQKLGMWVKTTRTRRRTGARGFPAERIAELDARGFRWSSPESPEGRWQQWIDDLDQFIRKTGHPHVPIGNVTAEGRRLGQWVDRVRIRRRTNNPEIPAEHIAQLDARGFRWSA